MEIKTRGLLTDPRISIITPSYNQGHFIEEAIVSVLNQGYANFEHIIIDGGSTDNTVDILKKYDHLVWVSEPDDGQSDAINKGFNLAKGDIIGWLNSDDIYLPDTFYFAAQVLANKDLDAVYANYRFVNSEGNITRELITQKSKKWMSVFYCFIPSTTFFFKRAIIDQGILIDKSFHIAMDKEFFAHIYHAGFKILKINKFFSHFRWHDNNKSIDTKEVKQIRLKEGIEVFNRYSGFNLPHSAFGNLAYKIALISCGIYRTICRKLRVGLYAR